MRASRIRSPQVGHFSRSMVGGFGRGVESRSDKGFTYAGSKKRKILLQVRKGTFYGALDVPQMNKVDLFSTKSRNRARCGESPIKTPPGGQARRRILVPNGLAVRRDNSAAYRMISITRRSVGSTTTRSSFCR